MAVLVPFSRYQRRGSVLLPTLFVLIIIVMLLSATLPLTVTGYGVARADRDRVAALAAAEAGLNWEIARINNRLWDKDDSGNTLVDGSGNPTLDSWPTETGTAPGTASTRVLLSDASGQWTQRFVVGTTVNPFSVGATGSFTIIAEGQVRAADGQIVRRRVKGAGGGLSSLFDTAAIFAFKSPSTTGAPAWSIGGSSTITGGCGSNGVISGNGGPTITVGPLLLWGSNASVTGVTTTGISVVNRPAKFSTDTADQAANLLRLGTTTGSGVVGWQPTGYDAGGNATGPNDKYSHAVNSQAEIAVASTGAFYRTVAANEFLDNKNSQPVLDGHLWNGSGYKLRLKPGVYYFAKINLGNNDVVEIANDWYQANGTALYDANHNAINGPATVDDYNSDRNRVTIFVDAVAGGHGVSYDDSSIGSGLYTALQGAKSTGNALRYRRPGNFRIYAKNVGNFGVSGSNSSSYEFNADVLHYNADGSGNYYGAVTLNSGCHLYGGLFGWTVDLSGGATVEQYGNGVFAGNDPVVVIPSGGTGGTGGGSGAGSGLGSGYGGWLWQEIASS
jgi:Tfp pilus assembly protein PilX